MEQATSTVSNLARQNGPARRVLPALAMAWIDQQVAETAGTELVPLTQACGRILARTITAGLDSPAAARAAIAGVAVPSQAIMGAHSYQPIGLRLTRGAIDPAGIYAALVRAGDPLPEGADAVVAREACAFPAADLCEIFAPVPPGHAVEPVGSHFSRGTLLLAAGQRLEPRDCALLAAAGLSQAPVVRRPRVEIILDEIDEGRLAVISLLLRGLIERDGGLLSTPPRTGLRSAHEPGRSQPDLILVAGRADSAGDSAVRLLAEWGALAILGVAQAPAESTAIGLTRQAIPAFILPLGPAGCLWAYEWLAGRALRRLAGRRPGPPLHAQLLRIRGKIVSKIGVSEVFPVRRLGNGFVEPAEALEASDLLGAVKADGFVITAEGGEGHGDGSQVIVYLQRATDEEVDADPFAPRNTATNFAP
jgi:molybdopterin molybdotransferase